MRDAAHDVLYTAVNSRGFEEENTTTGLMSWQIILIAADIIVGILLILFEIFVVRKGYQKRKAIPVKVETVEEKPEDSSMKEYGYHHITKGELPDLSRQYFTGSFIKESKSGVKT